jgi:methylated-DNA-[protein]-cysteine S-methyltransferase
MDGIWFAAAVNGKGQLVACAFSDRNKEAAESAVKERIPVDFSTQNDSFLNRRLQELRGLFSGRGKIDLKELDLSRVSGFRKRVYLQLSRIPRGKVTTYGMIARKLGSVTYSRAVGMANAMNPLPLAIPCHRVLPSSLHVGMYGIPGGRSSEGGYMKRALLEREGVRFQGDRVSKEYVWYPV